MAALAVDLLEEWLADGKLASRYSDYINEVAKRRNAPGGPEFRGVAFQSDFAAAIDPVARGMLALAKADTLGSLVTVVDRVKFLVDARFSGGFSDLMAVVHDTHGTSNGPSGLFAPFNSAGLKAVTLAAGQSSSGQRAAQLGLVLPIRSADPQEVNQAGFTFVGIELTGHVTCERISPVIIPESYLAFALGKAPHQATITPRYEGQLGLDETLFADAKQHLADKLLPNLPLHLQALADSMTA